MYRSLLLAICAVALAGCFQTLQTASNFSVTQEEVDGLRAGYNAAFLTPAAHYRALGYCATGTRATLQHPCANRVTVAKLQAIDKTVNKEFGQVQLLLDTNSATGMAAAWQTLQDGIANARSILITLGVQ